MIEIFDSGYFHKYGMSVDLNKTRQTSELLTDALFFSRETIVFLSHKHDDLQDLQDIIGFLQKEFKVLVYIDSKDSNMPVITSGETASRIKRMIKKCNRFILMATEGAIESK